MIDWDKVYATHTPDALPWGGEVVELFEKEKDFLRPYLKTGPRKRILDYGFGTGSLMKHMKTYGHKVYGAENSIVAIEQYLDIENSSIFWKYMKMALNTRIAHVEYPSALRHAFPKFDLITCIGVLHHINPVLYSHFIEGFGDIMRDDAKLIVAGWDKADNFIKEPDAKSKVTSKPVYCINSLEKPVARPDMRITDSATIGFYDDMFYKMDRLMRIYVMEKNK
ncbi:MAG: class I SAM-dependent methyltransferase [Rickettsiales bacterium]|jgi:SAM-dependent methyltransferase|nr:class I SAM-dependent methyltransferase [Rickettsiales bacterium]